MRKTFLLTLLILMCALVCDTSASASDSSVGRVPTVTRMVQVFSQLEGDLLTSVEKRDPQVVAKLLSDDFEMRIGAMPGNPVPRAAWVQQSFAEPKSSSAMEQVAVHDLGKIALVSYLWKVRVSKAAPAHDIFVVDVWRREANDWRLAIRYADPVGKDDYPVPGAAMTAPEFEKKE
jgi:ketosteroid isomerase-like protein